MLRKRLNILVGILFGFLILALIAVNALLVWVATGPRSLDNVSPYIASALSSEGKYNVTIGHTWLVWDGWRHPVSIRVRNVAVTTASGEVFSRFPEIALGIDIPALFEGEILPRSLSITKPVVSLLQNPDRSISFGLNSAGIEDSDVAIPAEPVGQQPTAPAPENAATAPGDQKLVSFAAVAMSLLLPDENSNFRKLRYIAIKHADATIGSTTDGVFFNATDTNVVFRRDHDGLVDAKLDGTILYDKYLTPIDATLTLNQKSVEGTFTFSQLMPGVLSELFSDNPHLKLLNVPLSGQTRLSMDKDGNVQRLNFNIDSGKGTLNSVYLDSPLDVAAMHAEGQVSNNLQDLQLDVFSANLAGSDILASGVVSLASASKDMAIRAKASIKNVPAGNVHAFWPLGVAPKTRDWITTNITAGNISEASANINIGFGDLNKPVLPKEDIDANIALSDADVTYLPDHPQIKKVAANVHVDGLSLDAAISTAQFMDETKLSEGRVYIADLNPDNPYLEVTLAAQSTAGDTIRFLNLPRLKKAEKLALNDKTATGTIKGKAKVGFHFYAPEDSAESDINFDIAADLINMSQPNFMNKFDLKEVNGAIVLNNDLLAFKGSGGVNGASVSDTQVKYLFKPQSGENAGFDTIIDVQATAPVESLPRFGYPAFSFLSGKVGVKATVKEGPQNEAATASIDLTNAAVQTDSLPWGKTAGQAASFDISTQRNEGGLDIPSFQLKGSDLDVRGSAALTKDLSGIQNVHINKLRLGETNLDILNYDLIPSGYKLSASGLVADVSPWMNSDPQHKKESTFSFQHFPALQLKANVRRMIVTKDHILNDVKAEVDCSETACKFANVAGTTYDQKPFSFRILRNPKGMRQLSINADNAGAYLGALGLIDGMDGGLMSVTGNYDDSKPDSLLKAKVSIGKFTVKGAPTLAKLLTLASFSGIIDALQGNGIQFDRLSAPFSITKDVITFENAKTYGSSIGLTADGTITFPKKTINIQGTVVPSYTLNNVLGKVPLVGSILTGGEGQGVFAARYSISGTTDTPDVTVNPLSFLTPGFLRGMFDVFDGPSTPSSQEESEGTEKKPVERPKAPEIKLGK